MFVANRHTCLRDCVSAFQPVLSQVIADSDAALWRSGVLDLIHNVICPNPDVKELFELVACLGLILP